ncbi:carbohydrate ABC transporter permease [Neogemmobacter tilapiae]|uniref:Maltose/maltodextrin transport system permease protein MalG n=1 Tax=Neogemmobacter tilapiae TaxID=875041 RepID=A0A918TJ16_9RHOB|nr:carbohydrate ABC transporter permease [Gemmobacter tilapiae]GHC51324.1 ABC transporter permease [Gemmobacter tilapiae]
MTIALPARPLKRRAHGWLITAICIAVIALMLLPLVMSTLASLRPLAETSATPPSYLPSSLSLENYRKVAEYQQGIWVYVKNSAVVAGMAIVICLALSVPAGFALARFPVPGKEVLFLIILASMMVPYQALLVPMFLMFSKLGLTASPLGLAILHAVLQLPFSVYLMRNSFEAIPKELEEAARVDGASTAFQLRRVFMPLAMPGMVTVALFAFIASWNEFIGALILMNTESAFTVPIMLTGVVSGDFGAVDWGALQASVIVSILPCLAVYLALQKYYVSGLLAGAVK